MLRQLVLWASHAPWEMTRFLYRLYADGLSCFISTPWPCVLWPQQQGSPLIWFIQTQSQNQRDSIVLFTIWHMHLLSASHCSGGHENVSLFGLCSISHCWMLYKAHSTCRVSASQPTWSHNEIKVDLFTCLGKVLNFCTEFISIHEVWSMKKKSNKWLFFLTDVSFAGNKFNALPNS